jgi:hypothetical protein
MLIKPNVYGLFLCLSINVTFFYTKELYVTTAKKNAKTPKKTPKQKAENSA